MHKSIVEAVLSHGAETPEKTAIADAKTSYSYSELCLGIYRTAEWLSSHGVNEGDCVLVECTQDTFYLILDMACELTGAVFVPFEKNAARDRISGIFSETAACCIIAASDCSDIGRYYSAETVKNEAALSEGAVRTCKAEPGAAEILFTTGTTGMPKGIIISHRANVAVAENICAGVKMSSGSVELIPLPLSHSHGLRTCYAGLLNGSTCVILDGIMNIPLFFNMIEKYGVNAVDISPTLAKLLLKIAGKGLRKYADRIDYIEIGTAALGEDVKAQLKEIFPKTRLYNFYGSTEAGRICALDFNEFDGSGCIGYPAVNAEFYIVDDDRNVIHSSQSDPGLIAVSGRMLMDGYLNSEELTRSTVSEGILYTSDIGYFDEEGRLYLIGRKGFVINYKGIKISPEEIEDAAIKFEGIADCACVPVNDDICGQVPKLFVCMAEGADFDKQAIIRHLKNNLEANRIPAYIEVIGNIPRSSTGKLLRKELMNEK